MSPGPLRVFIALSAWAIVSAVAAEDAPAPVRIRTEMLVVQVPQVLGLRLRPQLRDEKTVAAALAQLKGLITEGKATLVAAPVLWTKDGQRGVVENIEEIRYATEYAPPMDSQGFGSRTAMTIEERIFRIIYRGDIPTSFETRDTGVKLELEPHVRSDGQSVTLAIVPQHAHFEGYRQVLHHNPDVGPWQYAQPEFRTLKTTTKLTLPSGVWSLVSVAIAHDAAKTWELCLIRTTLQ